MKLGIAIINLIVFLLLGIVFLDNLNSIDVAPSKNNALQRQELSKIKKIKDVDSLYIEFEKQTELRIRERVVRSKSAIISSWQLGVASILLILNVFLIPKIRNVKKL